MADKRIQDLAVGTGLKGTDLTPIAKDNLDTTYTTSKYTVDDIKTYVQSDLATVATTGDYNDLLNLPTIPTIPTNVSAFTNDANYITIASIPTNVSAFTNDSGYLISSDLSTVAFSGNYNDLTNLPTIPTVPSIVSAFVNDIGYLISADLAPIAFSGDYNDLINLPTSLSLTSLQITGGSPGLGKVATSDAVGNLSWAPVPFEAAIATTGTLIDFTVKKIFNADNAPATGNITNNLTGAQLGIVQKIYHNDAVEPTFPAGWRLMGDGVYVPGVVNVIFAEWVRSTRVEYWIVQEQ